MGKDANMWRVINYEGSRASETSVAQVPGGLLFRERRLNGQGQTAICFVPMTAMEVLDYLRAHSDVDGA